MLRMPKNVFQIEVIVRDQAAWFALRDRRADTQDDFPLAVLLGQLESRLISQLGNSRHFMPLDNCIEAMRQTGRDMSERYKETSQGGLAVNLPEC